MYRKNLSLSSLFASAIALALLLTGCYGPKDMHVKTAWGNDDNETYDADGDGTSHADEDEPSLYEQCLERQRGRSPEAASASCERMMTNMESNNGSSRPRIISTMPIY